MGVVDGAPLMHRREGCRADHGVGPDVALEAMVDLELDRAVRVEGAEGIVPVSDVDRAVDPHGRRGIETSARRRKRQFVAIVAVSMA
jgi:hypothetical protein